MIIICCKECLNQSKRTQSEMVQDLPKKWNQELVRQDHKKLERCTSDLGSDRMDDNTITLYIARRPKNKIKGKEILKEKEMQEEKLVELETEEKSKGRMNSIILVEDVRTYVIHLLGTYVTILCN